MGLVEPEWYCQNAVNFLSDAMTLVNDLESDESLSDSELRTKLAKLLGMMWYFDHKDN